MNSLISTPLRCSLLLISVLFVSGCSSSDNPSSDNPSSDNPGSDGAQLPAEAQPVLEFVSDKTFRFSWQPAAGTQFYRVLENPDGTSGFTDISGELDASINDYDHRVALFARVNAQYLVQSCNDQGCVDSDVLMVTGTLTNAIGYFKASNPDVVDYFGSAVSLSADGNTLAVGAYGEDGGAAGINSDQGNNSANRAGAVYIFIRSGEQWQQQAYLKASNTDADDNFGWSLSLSADGGTLAVGAHGESSSTTGINGDQSDNSAEQAGAVYVFARSGEQWQQQAYLKASNTDAGDNFGNSVGLSASGDTLAVGALYEEGGAIGINGDQSDNSVNVSGAVYVFIRSGEQWQQQAYLKASNPGVYDWFGFSLSLNADGNTLAIGAAREDSAATGIDGDQNDNSMSHAGAVYVFVRSGDQWQQEAYLKASNAGFENSFGFSVSLSADGDTLVVGASGEHGGSRGINGDQNDLSADYSGAAYVFARSGGLWQQQAYLKASNTDADDRFGFSLSLSADGNTVVIGALREDSTVTGINGDQSGESRSDSGAAYVFIRSSGLWQQQAYLKASNTEFLDAFGVSVSLSADGNTLAIGAGGESSGAAGINVDQSDNSVGGSGAVYMF